MYYGNCEPWDLPLEAFLTLCEDCHSYEYEERPKAEQALLRELREKGFRVDAIKDLALCFNRLSLVHLPEVVVASYAWVIAHHDVQQLLVEAYLDHRRLTGGE